MSHQCEDEHHSHRHSPPPIPTNSNQSLYQFIDTSKLRCLNVTSNGANQFPPCFIKPQDQKYDVSKYLETDADCQMLLHIPFTGDVRIFSLILRCSKAEDGCGSPKSIKLYKNFNKNIDFETISDSKESYHMESPEDVGIASDGSVNTVEDDSTFVEHHLPRHVFQNCNSITLFFENNWSEDEDDLTRCYYLELRGEFTAKRTPHDGMPQLAVYEAAPNPADHQKLENEQESASLGM